MGRKYKGMDYSKISVRLDDELDRIVGRFCRERENGGKASDAVRESLRLMGGSMKLADAMETSICNLLDIAKVFDKIDGPTAPIYSEALREAATLLWVLKFERKKD